MIHNAVTEVVLPPPDLSKRMIRFDTSELERRFAECDEFIDLHGYQTIADEFIPEIQKALDRGVNVLGDRFPKYSPGYKRVRKAYGRQFSRRDLLLTGGMRESIALYDGNIITVSGAYQQIALGHITGQLGRTRIEPSDFFQVSERMERLAAQALELRFSEILER
jgi:hypothetical protein